MLKWMRLPALNAAGTNSNDTTEVQIGTGLTVPTWARSIKGLAAHVILLAVTTKETMSGYIRLANDQNTLDPLNFPLPCVTALTGAIATHHVEDHIFIPVEHDLTPNDIIRAYFAFDSATTGVHTAQAYILFSSGSGRNWKAQKSAVIAGSAVANTEAGTATISTIAAKTKMILGFWHYLFSYPTAAQTCGGYIKVKSAAPGWQEQEIPTNTLPSGLSTEIEPMTKPMWAIPDEIAMRLQGYSSIPFDPFPLTDKEDFVFTNYMDGTNTVAPAGRYGLVWLE